MELEEKQTPNDDESVINELLDQNSQLRLEIATLRAEFKRLGRELQLLEGMKQSQNIPPELLEKISSFDFR